jgi:hypothetical protein
MKRGKAQRIIVWGLGLIALALLLIIGRPIFESLRERLFLNPSQAIVGSWVPDESPDVCFEFTKDFILRHPEDPGSPLSNQPYRIASIDGRRLILIGPNPTDLTKENFEVPFSFESREVLLFGNGRFHRRKP